MCHSKSAKDLLLGRQSVELTKLENGPQEKGRILSSSDLKGQNVIFAHTNGIVFTDSLSPDGLDVR